MAKKPKIAAFDPKDFLSRIGAGRTNENYRAGDIIFRQGDAAEAVYYLQNGKIKISTMAESGKEAVIAILEPGDFFGEGCLIGQAQRTSAVTAMTDCAVLRMDKNEMTRELHSEAAFSELFIAYLLQRNSRVEEDFIDQLFNSSEKRLARTLLLLAHFGKDGKHEPIVAKISQEMLADMVGTTRSRVSFFMNKFRRLGFIDYNGHLHVHTSLLNMVLRDAVPHKRR